jgi:hypothetical protein
VDGDGCSAFCLSEQCGNGTVDSALGEECDPGDPIEGDCCTDDCRYEPADTPCGDGADTECTDPDTCDGSGTCLPNNATDGAACGDTGTECINQDTCMAGACQDNGFKPMGTPCGDPADTECTDPDTCDGAGACQPNHANDGAACGDTGTQCTNQDTCTGGSCQDNGFQNPGTPCGDPADTECTNPDTCNGSGMCQANNEADGFPCGDQNVDCHVDDTCQSGSCQDNGFENAGTPCSGGTCDAMGMCVAGCDCCTDFSNGFLSFETGLATGNCGVLRNFRCSNDANAACVVNSDCPASGVCNEVIGGGIPLNLECGGLYTGGGGNSVPLPFPVPDMGKSYTRVTSCDANTGVLISGPTAPGDGGGVVTGRNCTKGRTCTGGANNGATCVLDADCDSNVCTTNCVFGPPLPIPNAMTPPTSVCTINDVAQDASGTTQCNGGDTTVSAPLRSNVYLTGDLFMMTTPPNIPGVQPCPLCDRFCSVTKHPCNTDADCRLCNGTGNPKLCTTNADCTPQTCNTTQTCNTQTTCLGGPNNGLNCTPATSDSPTLGDLQNAYPTSHDCPPEPTTSITDSIGGLPIAFALTSGTIQRNGEDLGPTAGGNRVFAGFCRDNNIEGSGCFEGDTNIACPTVCSGSGAVCLVNSDCPASQTCIAGDLNGVPCNTDADCSSPYESCTQRTQITVFGQPDGQCLGDGALHTGTLVSVFDIPPTFDAVVDAAGDLPGPGTAMLQGVAQLTPP